MMIAFMINNSLFGRADLALTYYPSVFEFYWFVARTFHRMEIALQTQPLPKVSQSRGCRRYVSIVTVEGTLQGTSVS